MAERVASQRPAWCTGYVSRARTARKMEIRKDVGSADNLFTLAALVLEEFVPVGVASEILTEMTTEDEVCALLVEFLAIGSSRGLNSDTDVQHQAVFDANLAKVRDEEQRIKGLAEGQPAAAGERPAVQQYRDRPVQVTVDMQSFAQASHDLRKDGERITEKHPLGFRIPVTRPASEALWHAVDLSVMATRLGEAWPHHVRTLVLQELAVSNINHYDEVSRDFAISQIERWGTEVKDRQDITRTMVELGHGLLASLLALKLKLMGQAGLLPAFWELETLRFAEGRLDLPAVFRQVLRGKKDHEATTKETTEPPAKSHRAEPQSNVHIHIDGGSRGSRGGRAGIARGDRGRGMSRGRGFWRGGKWVPL